jgi:3-oxoacyl-[acyl-carrier protein] reductase
MKNIEKIDVSQPIALITGSRRGIGLGIAVEMSKAGFAVILNGTKSYEDSQECIEKIRSLGGICKYIQADISKREDRQKLIDDIQVQFGRLNILVNNAGVAPEHREDILSAGEKSFDRLININLKGPYFLTRDIANWMIEQRKNNASVLRIINISSINAAAISPARGEYCVSKAGFSMMTSLFAARLAEFGIGVFEIRPGITYTDMTSVVREKYDHLIAEGIIPIARWGQPEDIGKAAVAFCLDYFSYSTGDVINVDGGVHMKTF